MTESLSNEQLAQLSDFVAARMGLYFPKGRWRDLERHTKKAAKEFGFIEIESFLRWLLSSSLNREQVETLASFLTISETYFWREPHIFEALRNKILPELIQTRQKNGRQLRLWSAGCATGEEPYSLAIALRQALPDWKNWHITLLATDINPYILRRAAAGVYGEWSFRNSPDGFKERYFTPLEKGKYEIHADIRKMVTFAYLNLAVDTFPTTMNDTNAMDVIFCRNVLMYFSAERARLVGQQLYNCLVEGGWFIVSSSELSQQTYSQFSPVHFPDAFVYRRDSSAPKTRTISPNGEFSPATKTPKQPSLPVVVRNPLSNNPPPLQPSQAQVQMPPTPVQPEMVSERTLEPSQVVRELANQGKLLEAWDVCETSLAADKLNPGLHYLGATILQELNREEVAIQLLKRALYLDPNYLLAYFALGNLAQRNGNFLAARKNFENVLAILKNYSADDILPEADGLTAGRLNEIIRTTLQTGDLT